MPPKHLTKNLIPLGMNSYDDSTKLADGVFQLVENMRPDKKTLYTREGCAKYNVTAEVLPTSSGVFGVFNYHKTDGTAVELAVSMGKLYSGEAGVFTERHTGLNATNLCSIVQRGKYGLVVDQASGILVYTYGVTPYLAGLPSPKCYKLIANFESTETWVVTDGSQAADTGYFVQGTQSILFTSTATTPTAMICTRTLTAALNLALFPDGSVSSTADYISFWMLRFIPANFVSFTIQCRTDASNYYWYIVSGHATWTGTTTPYASLEFKILKSAFTATLTPNWNNITSIVIQAVADTGDTAVFNLDFLRLEKAPIIATPHGTGNLNGIYLYKMTFESADGEESDGGLVSTSATTTSTQHIDLTNLPLAGGTRIKRRNLYRYGGSLTVWKLVTVFTDNLTTTYADDIADVSLGATWTEIDGQPYIPKCITLTNDSVVIGNLTGPDGVTYGSGVMISQPDSVEIYSIDDFFELDRDTGFNVMWLHYYSTRVYVGKGNSIWSFDPNNLDIPPIRESRLYAGAGPAAVCEGENGFYFLDKNKAGVIFFNGQSFTNISDTEGAPSKIRNYIANIPNDYIHLCWMTFMSNTLFVGVPQVGETYPSTILAYYVPMGFWYVITGATWKARCAYVDRTTMHIGHATTGYVYNCFSGTLDDTAAITSILWTKDDDFAQPEIGKEYQMLILDAACLDATAVVLTAILYQDLANAATIYHSVSGSAFGHGAFGHGTFGHMTAAAALGVHKRLDLPCPQIGWDGTYLSTKITSTNRWIFRGLTQIARIAEPLF